MKAKTKVKSGTAVTGGSGAVAYQITGGTGYIAVPLTCGTGCL